MSEGIVIALIGFVGAVLGAAIAGFATVTAAGIKGKGEGSISCGLVGLLASLGAAGGLVLGAVFGASLIRNQAINTPQPSYSIPTPPPQALQTASSLPPTAAQLLNHIDRFRVMGNTPKNRTGAWVNIGDAIYIEYLDGQWTGEKGKQPLNTGCGFYFDDPYSSHIYPLDPKQNTGAALIGYIGNQPFLVGCKSFNSIATASGELYLGMNDCQGCFWDNDGEIYVRISITKK
ncbi:MAG: hypothetical protein QXZ09_06870 [Candidatus Methanomethylicaceae archaeon]